MDHAICWEKKDLLVVGFSVRKKGEGERGGGVRSIGRYYLRCTGALQIGVVQEQVGGDSVLGGGEV